MFPCTLSILKPIHTDYFPKQTRAFQADKGISGRKESDWKRLTVRFASNKKKTYFTFYSWKQKLFFLAFLGICGTVEKDWFMILWSTGTNPHRLSEKSKFGTAIELAIPQFISAFAGWGFLCVSESSESTEYLLRHQGSIKAAHLFLSSGV